MSQVSSSEKGLQLQGELTFETVSSVLSEGNALLESHKDPITINLEGVNRIDSAGISLLLEWKRICDNKNKTFLVEGMQKQATSLIKTYQLQKLFQ